MCLVELYTCYSMKNQYTGRGTKSKKAYLTSIVNVAIAMWFYYFQAGSENIGKTVEKRFLGLSQQIFLSKLQRLDMIVKCIVLLSIIL